MEELYQNIKPTIYSHGRKEGFGAAKYTDDEFFNITGTLLQTATRPMSNLIHLELE